MAAKVILMLGAMACAAVLAADEPSPGAGVIDEYCRQFHRECSEARAQGYRDVGICNVERLECTTNRTDQPEAGVGRRPRGMDGGRDAPEDQERSIGP